MAALSALSAEGEIPTVDVQSVEISEPRSPEHGDYACNIALALAKKLGLTPPEFAHMLARAMEDGEVFEAIEVAGPGFLNFRLQPWVIASSLAPVLDAPESFYRSLAGSGQRINVEFVSVNPNGPITIGSGRGAAYGSALCNVLAAAGNTVHREYYINDGVNSEQMRLFAASVRYFAQVANGVVGAEFPDGGYKGDYVEAVGKALAAQDNPDDIGWWQQQSQAQMLHAQREALADFGVEFDCWFSEQSLHDSGAVATEIDRLVAGGVADDQPVRSKLKLAKGGVIAEVEREAQVGLVDDEGNAANGAEPAASPTLWLRSTRFGDDMDRVLRRQDGRLTYISSDVAYHWDKFNRPPNADRLITVLGPDHHGYIGRLQAVLAALLLAEGLVPEGEALETELTEAEAQLFESSAQRVRCGAALDLARQKLDVQIYQLVRFLKDGKPAPMRKRDGNIYALSDLMREIGTNVRPTGSKDEQREAGKDVARFFYLLRSHDTTFDFDLDLAERQSDENPVFYVQYAHARISSVIAKGEEAGLAASPEHLRLLAHPRELDLIKKIVDLPGEVQRCAADHGVHRLATYSIALARAYHSFYDTCRVVQVEEPAISSARLALCEATRAALRGALALLGVSAPERMSRTESGV